MSALQAECGPRAKVFPSPNHDERGGRRPDMLVLHYTNMASASEALQLLCNPVAEVSSHYFVFEDGRILQLVPEGRRAWHAGRGSWAGEDALNAMSLGIEIAHPGHAGGMPPYPDAQIEAVIALSRDIVARLGIRADRVLAHSDVAPDRKEDPGETFPWGHLAREGVGHWVPSHAISDGRFFARGDAGQPVEALQAMLALYGYGIAITGEYDLATEQVVTAFQRHFRPERVDGVADASTITTLRDLIASRPAAA